MFLVSDDLIAETAFQTHWPSYNNALMRINATRYRGLGDERTKNFARCAWDDALMIRLRTVGAVCWYLIPCSWLGLHFRDDPRYFEMARALHGSEPEGERIEIARQHFIRIAEQTTGLNGERVPAALRRTKDAFHQLSDPGITTNDIVNISLAAWDIHHDSRTDFPRNDFVDASRQELAKADIEGDMSGETMLKMHVGMAFWLGTGFLRDPQYAWVSDSIMRSRAIGHPPMQALVTYAQKRLDRVSTRYDENRE